MGKQRYPKTLKVAATGALACSLLGPTLGALAMLTFGAERQSLHDAVAWLKIVPFALLVAMLLVGPASFVLGGIGALLIQFISKRVHSAKALVFPTAVLGLLLGGAVPVVVDIAFAVLMGGRNRSFETGLLPLGAVIGLVCASTVCWLLYRMRLLCFQQSLNSETL